MNKYSYVYVLRSLEGQNVLCWIHEESESESRSAQRGTGSLDQATKSFRTCVLGRMS